MKKILVTGATGFLGSRVVSELITQGHDPKLVIRDQSKLAPELKQLETVVGDLRDKDMAQKALEGCDRIIHVAGLVSTSAKDERLLYEMNYQISLNLFQAALDKKIKKFIYTSTSSCLGAYKGPDRKEHVAGKALNIAYIDSKQKALDEALNFCDQGLPLVILCPTLILGEGDVYLNSSELVYSFLKRQIPGYIDGGVNPIYVGDAALAHVNALKYGKDGEIYVIAGEMNVPLRELFLNLEKLSGVQAPKIKIPYRLAMFLAQTSELLSSKPKLNKAAVKLAGLYWYFNCEKMKKVLKVEPSPLFVTLEKSISWIQETRLKDIP